MRQAERVRRKEHVAVQNFEKRSEFRFLATRRKRGKVEKLQKRRIVRRPTFSGEL